jgi:O-acetyl-ADP-ribose deacetylase (regulator of RNase III)
MILYEVGNLLESIEKYKLDCIMNAANGKGPMGRGIAGAIKRYGGQEIQNDAYKVCNEWDPQPGQAYCTISGKLEQQGIKCIIHSVTMKQPGGPTSYDIVSKAFRSALDLAKVCEVTRIGCTALGTGVGELNSVEVAKRMYAEIKNDDIDIIFIDFDSNFIDKIKQLHS